MPLCRLNTSWRLGCNLEELTGVTLGPGKRLIEVDSPFRFRHFPGHINDVAHLSWFVENLVGRSTSDRTRAKMGLDAFVCCNCVREGKARPHPFPELLAFDKTGEPILRKQGEISLDLWLAHDKWHRDSCPHSGYLVQKRLGNVTAVAYVRGFFENNSPNSFPILLERVVYSGTHSGDLVAAKDVTQLLTETRRLQGLTSDSIILEFANDVIQLAEASIATGNPIVF